MTVDRLYEPHTSQLPHLKEGYTKIGLEYKQVSSFSDHMQRMTVEEFGERLKEQWKILMRDLK